MKFKRCEQRLHDCFACTPSGCCKVLNDTSFKNDDGDTYKCPFYKKRKDVPYDTDDYATSDNDKEED